MHIQEFDYELPEELIAQKPSEKRENSKMMVLNRSEQKIEHKNFFNIAAWAVFWGVNLFIKAVGNCNEIGKIPYKDAWQENSLYYII